MLCHILYHITCVVFHSHAPHICRQELIYGTNVYVLCWDGGTRGFYLRDWIGLVPYDILEKF